MKKLLSAVPMILLALFLTACAPNQGAEPSPSSGADDVIGIRGTITSRSETDSGITILVEGEIMADTQYDKASVRVAKEAIAQNDVMGRVLELSDLTVGTTVEVVFEGPVAESYPVQGTARIVRVLSQ